MTLTARCEAGIANPAAACKDPEDRYMRVFRSLWMDQGAPHGLRTHPIVIDLFPRIFGEPALAHPMFVQRNIFHRGCHLYFARGVTFLSCADTIGTPVYAISAGHLLRVQNSGPGGLKSDPARRFHRGV